MNANDALEIARLAALDMLDYQHERKAAAKALGCSVTALDKIVRTARGSLGTGPSASKPLVLNEIVPWDDEVDGVELVGETFAAFGRHVILGDPQKLTSTFWTMHAHTAEASSISPRLAATSPFPESGKTTLLKVLRYLVPRPLHAVSLRGPTLFRTIECWRPTMMLDEANNWLFGTPGGGGDDTKGDMMAIIDAGHERGVVVPRLVPSGNGGDWVPHGFEVFGPLAIALIGKLPEQIDSRAIEIVCIRRDANQPITPLHARRPPPELADLARKHARWAADHSDLLAEWEPVIPEGVSNRTADNWWPLLSIAEVVDHEASPGQHSNYALLVREAAIASGKASKANRVSSNTRLLLLSDLQWLFDSEWKLNQQRPAPQFASPGEVKMSSEDITEELAKLEERPWAEWGPARKPISKVQLARLLAP